MVGMLMSVVSLFQPAAAPFERENLLAWCIVPFDGKKRGPEERVAMLAKLGFKHYAYDWRAEHLPTFERELLALKKHAIALDAVWFPAELNRDARFLLDVLQKQQIRTQLWVMLVDPAPKGTHEEKVAAAVALLKPIVEAAARIECRVGLYNHGGWFGEPENQLAVLSALQAKNVGMVYNLHHGHDHLPRFAEVLKKMEPHLYALNLNGMFPHGDKQGKKIVVLGQGTEDVQIIKAIQASGYRGLIGIIGHTNDDVEARLLDNLDGLAWLVKQLKNPSQTPKPVPRTK